MFCILLNVYYDDRMSIFQNYEKHKKLLGEKIILAIDDYIDEMCRAGYKTSYSHIIYNQKEFEKFKKWLSKRRRK